MAAMDSRRLVVWIAAGILGFQGGTLVLDLLNCSVLSWLYVRRHGLELSTPAPATAQKQPVGEPLPRVAEGGTGGLGYGWGEGSALMLQALQAVGQFPWA